MSFATFSYKSKRYKKTGLKNSWEKYFHSPLIWFLDKGNLNPKSVTDKLYGFFYCYFWFIWLNFSIRMENEKLFNRPTTTKKVKKVSFFFSIFILDIIYIFCELIYTMKMRKILATKDDWTILNASKVQSLNTLFSEVNNLQQGQYRKLLKIVLQNWLNFKFILPGIGKTVWFAFFLLL